MNFVAHDLGKNGVDYAKSDLHRLTVNRRSSQKAIPHEKIGPSKRVADNHSQKCSFFYGARFAWYANYFFGSHIASTARVRAAVLARTFGFGIVGRARAVVVTSVRLLAGLSIG